MEDAIGCLAQNILDTLSTAQLQAWIRGEGLGDDIQMLESEVEMVQIAYAALGERSTGNRPLGRSLACLKDLLYDADDLVDDLDYCRLVESSPTTGSLVIGYNDTPIQSTSADLFVGSPSTDSSDDADMFEAVRVHEELIGDIDIHSRQGSNNRSPVRERFVVSEAGENNRPVKAKCVHCGSELNCGPKHGTPGLKHHIHSLGCTSQNEVADQPLNPSSSADVTENGE